VVAWPVAHVKGRYARFTATQLFLRWNDFVFALAELEVYSEGRNVAGGRRCFVRSLRRIRRFGRSILVDGRSSSGRLLDVELGRAGWRFGLS